MRNREQWVPSKYVWDGRRWAAARDPHEVNVGSRLLGDIVAALYAAAIPHYTRGDLLDLGCGKAPFYAMYRPYVTSCLCADWPNTKHGVSFLDVHTNLNEGLPFASQCFDTVILSDVLEHLPEPQAVWQEMARVMRPGAALILNTPFFYGLHEAPFDYYRYTEYALRRFAAGAGFEVLLLRAIGGSPEALADITAKHLQQAPLVGAAFADGLQRAVARLVATGPGARLSAATSAVFPFGYFLVARRKTG
jgi:SAM-dependent methyltransferase